jgi:hypothetical protein
MRLPSVANLFRDRRILERTILPYLSSRDDFQTILFVGCHWYTRRYNALFVGREYVTIDIDPRQARHGAPRHITDSMENLGSYFRPGALDAIVCNGVVGWGLDEPDAIERSFSAAHEGLRTGGLLVVGWNDTPRRSGRRDEGEESYVDRCKPLARFSRFDFPGLAGCRHATRSMTRHVFDFYIK